MFSFNTWQDMLKNTSYANKDKYMDRYVYPDTGNVNLDYQILIKTFSFLQQSNYKLIDDYFYWLDFFKNAILEIMLFIKDADIPPIYDYSIIDTENFVVIGALGSLVSGYSLISSREHILSMSNLDTEKRKEYINLLMDLKKTYSLIWNKKPIIFEHGTSFIDQPKASSIIHTHTHIVNHNYKNEKRILEQLHFIEVDSIEKMLDYGKEKNYISYISPDDRFYITFLEQEQSQIMRRFIAQDIGRKNDWDWRKSELLENSFETAKQLLLYKINNNK